MSIAEKKCVKCGEVSKVMQSNPYSWLDKPDNGLYCETCFDRYLDYTSIEYNPFIMCTKEELDPPFGGKK